MSMGRRLAAHRCPGCEIRRNLCFCALIPRITLDSRVIILMHTGEEVLPSNTARLAVKALTNSELRVYGRKDERMSTAGLVEPGRRSLLLFPSPQSRDLTEVVASTPGPYTLIVPDGKWRQSLKLTRREPTLAGIPHVRLPAGELSRYQLRMQPNDFSLCTLEAIARALGVMESNEARERLEWILRVMVERTLWCRGQLPAEQATAAGIPPEARRH